MRIDVSEKEYAVEGSEIIIYQKMMMEQVSFLLPHQWDGDRLIYRQPEEDGQVSLAEWSASAPGEADCIAAEAALWELLEETERFLMDEERLYFDPAWLFWNKEEKKLRALYFPFRENETPEQEENSFFPDGLFYSRISAYLWQRAAECHWEEKGSILQVFRLCESASEKASGNSDWGKWIGMQKAPEPDVMDFLYTDEPQADGLRFIETGSSASPEIIPDQEETDRAEAEERDRSGRESGEKIKAEKNRGTALAVRKRKTAALVWLRVIFRIQQVKGKIRSGLRNDTGSVFRDR